MLNLFKFNEIAEMFQEESLNGDHIWYLNSEDDVIVLVLLVVGVGNSPYEWFASQGGNLFKCSHLLTNGL